MSKEKKEKKASTGMGGNVRQQHPPFYNVVSGGQTVEWTDKLSEASAAFKDAGTKPKFIWQIDGANIRLVNSVL